MGVWVSLMIALGVAVTAAAVEPRVITLSCDGTITDKTSTRGEA
jgi:hypothetical protein